MRRRHRIRSSYLPQKLFPCFLSAFRFPHSLLSCELLRFRVWLKQLPAKQGQQDQRHDQADRICRTDKETAELPNYQSDYIGKTALIADGKPGPFVAVHLALDGTDSRKTGSAQQIKQQEAVCGELPVTAGECLTSIISASVLRMLSS